MLRQLTAALGWTALGLVLMIVGLTVLSDYTARFGAWWGWIPIGILSIAFGEFLFAVIAEDLAPGADPRLSGILLLAPWVVVVAVLATVGIGVLHG